MSMLKAHQIIDSSKSIILFTIILHVKILCTMLYKILHNINVRGQSNL